LAAVRYQNYKFVYYTSAPGATGWFQPLVPLHWTASLAGYITPLDRGLSWLEPFESSEEDYGDADFYRSIDAVLVGSQTFKQASQFPQWPYPDKLCWVFSRQRLSVSLPHVFVTDQRPWEVVAELDRRGCQRAWLVGGGQLAGSFRVQSLIT